MNDATQTAISALEERLEQAMRMSDVAELDALLADDLLFTNDQGRVVSKQEDLHVHRSGLLKIDALTSSQRTIRILDRVAVVAVHLQLAGRHDGNPFEGRFRFTRVWAVQDARWQVVAAHSSAASI